MEQIHPPLPPASRKVRDEAGCLDVLERVILWCQEADSSVDAPLTDRQRYFLLGLAKRKATSYEKRQTTQNIEEAVAISVGNYKRPVSDLQKLGYVETRSGRSGGVWLTEKGLKKAAEIASESHVA